MSSPVFQKIIKNVKDAFWNPELDTQEEEIVFVREEAFSELKAQVLRLQEAEESIESELKAITVENKETLNKIKEMIDAHRGLEEKVDALSGLEKKVSELTGLISDLKGDVDARFKEVQKGLTQQGEKARAFDSALSKLERQVEALAQTIRDNAVQEGRFKELEGRMEGLERDRDRLEEDLKVFSDGHKVAEERYHALEAELKDMLEKAHAFLEESTKFESEFKKIHSSHKKLRDQVSEYSRFIEVILLDKINERLAKVLSEDMGIEVQGAFENDEVPVGDGKSLEFEIVGHAQKDGTKYLIAGTFVKQLKKKDLTDFLKKIDKVKAHHQNGLIPIVVTNQAPAQVKKFASKQDVKLYLLSELF